MPETNRNFRVIDEYDSSVTIPEFCRRERISLSSYHKQKRRGLGPEELRIPGSNIVRITLRARREWHARMAELAQQHAALLEQQRRVELARVKGKAAAQSPLHVSRRGDRRNRNGHNT
jgi:hypothetical protein